MDAKNACKVWIEKFAKPRKTINRNYFSYGLKHAVENYWRKQDVLVYVPEEVFV